jgi:hypothetical protein
MPLAVVLNRVPAADYFLRQIPESQHPFADTKKCRACVVLIQLLEHLRRHFRIRPIIDGDGHAAGHACLRR